MPTIPSLRAAFTVPSFRWLGLLAVVPFLAGCVLTQVDPPPGAGTLRYRDVVFPSVSVTTDLQYGSAPDSQQNPVALKLDLYQPVGDPIDLRPAVIWVHGGGFVGGDKSTEGYLVQPLVQRGYVAVTINYRLLAPGGCSGSNLPAACVSAASAAINDGQSAVRWLRANAATLHVDPNRISIEGFSAGGIVATGVGLLSDQPGAGGNPGYSSKVRAWLSVSGGLPGGQGDDATDPPGYLFHGTADQTVPYQWSLDTANALDRAGVFVALDTENGYGHQLPDLTYLSQQTVNFFYLENDLAHAQR